MLQRLKKQIGRRDREVVQLMDQLEKADESLKKQDGQMKVLIRFSNTIIASSLQNFWISFKFSGLSQFQMSVGATPLDGGRFPSASSFYPSLSISRVASVSYPLW